MAFRVVGLSPEPFRPLFDLSDEALERIGARRVVADNPRLPCRISLAHAEPGEELCIKKGINSTKNSDDVGI